jgi:mRNA-degrading endonuclease RelE of RelBE toxin-antitoxin system
MYNYRLSKTVIKFLEKRDNAFLLRFEEKLMEVRKDPHHPVADVEPYK